MRNAKEINYNLYKLNYLVWSDVYCYGKNNYIDFRTFKNNLVVLNGNNKEGKSSVIDILMLVLFNVVIRGNKKHIINKKEKTGYVKLSFNID